MKLVDSEGIRTIDDKIKSIKKFPTPTSVDNIRSFLGLSDYYRPFVKGYASLASPLTQLLKKDTNFHWGPAQEDSFQRLKIALTHAPILALPDFTQCSLVGIGPVLM